MIYIPIFIILFKRKVDEPRDGNCNYRLELVLGKGYVAKGTQYSTIYEYRSANSSHHGLVKGKKVSEHPTLIRLLKGVFNMRSPTQSLALSWDLSKVLTRLREPHFESMLDVPLKWVSRQRSWLQQCRIQ